jgi:hypothetical protein
MQNHFNLTFSLDMTLFFVQSLPANYKEAILQMLLRQNSVQSKKLSFEYGAGKDAVLYVAPDFNAPLEDFNEYM